MSILTNAPSQSYSSRVKFNLYISNAEIFTLNVHVDGVLVDSLLQFNYFTNLSYSTVSRANFYSNQRYLCGYVTIFGELLDDS